MNREEMRRQLAELKPRQAVSLARRETAFWDTNTLQNLADSVAVIKFLLGFTPVEAVAMVSLMPTLTRGFLVKEITGEYSLQTIGVALRSWKVSPSEFLELKKRILPFVELLSQFRAQLLMDDKRLAEALDKAEDSP